MPETYEVDPDGDLLISLAMPVEDTIVDDDQHSMDPPANSHRSSQPKATDRTCEEVMGTISNKSHSQISFKVSSKHLTLASRPFNKMLLGGWKEARKEYEDGLRHVDLAEGFDSEALRTLLDILHGKTRTVPRSTTLEMLTNLAVLVDYFECHEPVEVWSDLWIQELEGSLPTNSSADVYDWILISVVFQKPAIFNSITRTAAMHQCDPINKLDLPIPKSVDGRFDPDSLSSSC